mgnify:CR=1 FL=1
MLQQFRNTAICMDSDAASVSGCFLGQLAPVKKRPSVTPDYLIEAQDEQTHQKSGQRASTRWCARGYVPVDWHFTRKCDTSTSTLLKSQLIHTSHTVGQPRLNAKGSRGVSTGGLT